MDNTKDALLRVVKAARAANRLAQDMKKILIQQTQWTWADEIAGWLNDALFMYSGEKLRCGDDFADSKTMRLIRSEMSDMGVTMEFIVMAENNRNGKDEIQQPKPVFFDEEEMQKMMHVTCESCCNNKRGYVARSEAEELL